MKEFALIIMIGRKVIYQSIFSFTPEQYQVYLEELLRPEREPLQEEICQVVWRTIGARKFGKEETKWRNMSVKDYAAQHPDILIRAGIQSMVYGNLFGDFGTFADLKKISGAEETVVSSGLESYSWKCILLKTDNR